MCFELLVDNIRLLQQHVGYHRTMRIKADGVGPHFPRAEENVRRA